MTAYPQTAVKVAGITKRYGDGAGLVTALAETSLTIRAGEFVAVMGPSGSGKSSLMNLVGLLDRPSSGRIALFGRDTTLLSADSRARLRNRHIGFVFQAYHLMAGRTGLGNVELPLAYRGIRRRERTRRAELALAAVGLTAKARCLPAEMSGGEQQRVAITRALVGGPDLIVADEPTGALDTASSGQVLDLLRAACGQGRTVLLVTHDPVVARRADRLIRLGDGRVIADGSATAEIDVGRSRPLAPPEAPAA